MQSFQNSDREQGINEEVDYYENMADVLFDYYDEDQDAAISAAEFMKFSDDMEEQQYDDYPPQDEDAEL